MVFFRNDEEKSLGGEFRDWISELRITYEFSAPDTAAQNGHAEKKGYLLTINSRAMIIEAGLPEYLWPWIFQTAGYLMNRTPMKKHEWKTPHEIILKKKNLTSATSENLVARRTHLINPLKNQRKCSRAPISTT